MAKTALRSPMSNSKPSEAPPPAMISSTVLAAVIALLILGAGSVFLTWQTIRRQRELVDQHLLLSAGAVLIDEDGVVEIDCNDDAALV